MLEAFRVGPVEMGDGNLTLYVACSPAGAVSVIAADDRSGLAELRRRAPAEAAATCEPGLAVAGAQLGFRAAALSERAKHARATFATMLHLGRSVEPGIVEQIPQTIEVAQRFMRARPWQLVRPEVPVEITIAIGGRERRLVASVLGADEIQHGLALYESAAELARFIELAEQDRPDGLLTLPYTSLTIDPEPRWVADAVEAAFGLPIVVVPVATGAGGPRAVTPEELTALAAAMFAVTRLAPGRLAAEVTIEVEGGGQCRAMARIPARAAVSAPPLPAWAARPIPMSGPVPAAILTVPVLPVEDLAAAAAGLRALGFQVTEAVEGQVATATASWPGLMLQLVRAPSVIGGCCQVVVEAIEPLVAAWRSAGVEVRVIESDGERLAHVEVPGGLTLTFGDQLPAGHQAPARARRRAPRRRAS